MKKALSSLVEEESALIFFFLVLVVICLLIFISIFRLTVPVAALFFRLLEIGDLDRDFAFLMPFRFDLPDIATTFDFDLGLASMVGLFFFANPDLCFRRDAGALDGLCVLFPMERVALPGDGNVDVAVNRVYKFEMSRRNRRRRRLNAHSDQYNRICNPAYRVEHLSVLARAS